MKEYSAREIRYTTDSDVLAEVLRRDDDIYNDAFLSLYAVENPNCPSEALVEVLRRGKNDEISGMAAFNLNCPPEVLVEVLRRGENNDVSYYAAANPRCPSEALVEVLRREKLDMVSQSAAENPNCPPEILSEILRKGRDDEVSYSAAMNINCPYKERFEWLERMGKLTKYDPEKFELEHNEEDKDLEELRKLM